MRSTSWNPEQYLRFGGQRQRALSDLLAQVPLTSPRHVVDLGCGPGTDTPLIRERWPAATVLGLDSSPEMVQAARQQPMQAVEYRRQSLQEWLDSSDGPVPDLVVSNAMFQWVPDHLPLVPQAAERVGEGGAFALQVPANFQAPLHTVLRETAARHGYSGEPLLQTVVGAAQYLEVLSRPGWGVDAWETTYFHVLEGQDAAWEWIAGAAARPVLQNLTGADRDGFVADCRAGLREAYPPGPAGTVVPFARVFVVASRC